MITTDDMLEAYYDCRKSKRKTASAVMYEIDYESKLIALKDRINSRAYSPGKSICFVVTRPRYREVFAASLEYKDRAWGGKWDFIDFGMTILGVIVGYLIRLLICLLKS